MKPASEHITFLDYLRGIAILCVFFVHSLGSACKMTDPPWNGWLRSWHVLNDYLFIFPVTLGQGGVAMFFAISGFCIHLSHQRSRYKGYTVFFLRRFFRIYPPYLLALLFFAFVFYPAHLHFGVANHDWSAFKISAGDLVSHIFMFHNLIGLYFYGINGVFWTISIEMQLYLLYPLLLWLAMRRGWLRALWITGIIELGMRSFVSLLVILHSPLHLTHFYTGSPLYYWFSWTIGAALAEAYLKGEPLPFRGAMGLIWPFLLIGSYFLKPLVYYIFPLAALTTTCFMAQLLSQPARSQAVKNWKFYALEHLRWAGIVSFSAYLVHQPLVNQVPNVVAVLFHPYVFSPLAIFGFCMASWFPIFGLSYLLYRYVEQPSIAWGKRIVEMRQRTISPSPRATETPSVAIP